jgi:hypothetical protein
MAIVAVEFKTHFKSDGYMARKIVNAAATTITTTTFATKIAITGENSGCEGMDLITAEMDLDFGAANNVRVVCMGLHTTGGDEYLIPYTKIQEHYEFQQDADYLSAPQWEVNKRFPIYKFYAWMGTDGGADSAIDSVAITVARR